jgi:hypothetical protein
MMCVHADGAPTSITELSALLLELMSYMRPGSPCHFTAGGGLGWSICLATIRPSLPLLQKVWAPRECLGGGFEAAAAEDATAYRALLESVLPTYMASAMAPATEQQEAPGPLFRSGELQPSSPQKAARIARAPCFCFRGPHLWWKDVCQ